MSKFKGTPGPWFAVNYGGFIQIQTSDYYDAGVDVLDEEIQGDKAKMNSQLVASSPELLEALEYLINCNEVMRFKCELPNALEKAKLVYNKALGL